MPITTGDEISFKKNLLSDVDKWTLQNMAEVAAKVPETKESNPPKKRARLKRSQDPCFDFRDGASSSANFNRLSTSFHDENVLAGALQFVLFLYCTGFLDCKNNYLSLD